MRYKSNRLFSDKSLAVALEESFLDAAEDLMNRNKNRADGLTDNELVEDIVAYARREPIRFNKKVAYSSLSKVDEGLKDRDVTHVRGAVELRFRGYDELFHYYPEGIDCDQLRGKVCSFDRTLTLEACVPIGEISSLMPLLQAAVLDVKEVTDEQKLQIEAFEARLPDLAREYVQRRNDQLEEFAAIKRKLGKIRI